MESIDENTDVLETSENNLSRRISSYSIKNENNFVDYGSKPIKNSNSCNYIDYIFFFFYFLIIIIIIIIIIFIIFNVLIIF